MRVILDGRVRQVGHDIPLTLTLSHQGRENREYRGERTGRLSHEGREDIYVAARNYDRSKG